MASPIELHTWATPNGHKVSIALEEMGLPYDVRWVNIGKNEQFAPEFLALSPNNRIPAILDPEGPDGAPITLFESGAILQYLGRKTGKFYPEAPRARAEVEQWLFWQMGGVGPMAGQAHHFLRFAPEDVPYGKKRYSAEVTRLYTILDKRLADRDFVAGEYSIADMALWPWVRLWEMQAQDISGLKNLSAWLERVNARPAVQRGLIGKDEAARVNPSTPSLAKTLFDAGKIG